LPEKSIDFKVILVANGQLSALITPGWPATDNFFQRLVPPIQRKKSTEVTIWK
jgi:hypothetical protein